LHSPIAKREIFGDVRAERNEDGYSTRTSRSPRLWNSRLPGEICNATRRDLQYVFFHARCRFLLAKHRPHHKWLLATDRCCPQLASWIWALVIAMLNTGSYLALYRAFQVGVLSIVAPVASGYAAISVLFSILSGEKLTATALLGIVVVLVGVVLAVTTLPHKKEGGEQESRIQANAPPEVQVSKKRRLPAGVGWACLAALGLGITFWSLGFVVEPKVSALVTTWFLRLVPLCLLGSLSPFIPIQVKIKSSTTWAIIIGTGILDTVGFLSSTAGLATGQIAIVSVLSSLYSAITVVLAWIFLKERLRWNQWIGITCILGGIVLATR